MLFFFLFNNFVANPKELKTNHEYSEVELQTPLYNTEDTDNQHITVEESPANTERLVTNPNMLQLEIYLDEYVIL